MTEGVAEAMNVVVPVIAATYVPVANVPTPAETVIGHPTKRPLVVVTVTVVPELVAPATEVYAAPVPTI